MKARGKREAQRNASPLVTKKYLNRALKVRNTTSIIPLFQSFTAIAPVYQGRRASRCSALVPRLPLSRLRRLSLAFIFRLRRLPWLSYSAPLALSSDFVQGVASLPLREVFPWGTMPHAGFYY